MNRQKWIRKKKNAVKISICSGISDEFYRYIDMLLRLSSNSTGLKEFYLNKTNDVKLIFFKLISSIKLKLKNRLFGFG